MLTIEVTASVTPLAHEKASLVTVAVSRLTIAFVPLVSLVLAASQQPAPSLQAETAPAM